MAADNLLPYLMQRERDLDDLLEDLTDAADRVGERPLLDGAREYASLRAALDSLRAARHALYAATMFERNRRGRLALVDRRALGLARLAELKHWAPLLDGEAER